jgi:hypothetical protein
MLKATESDLMGSFFEFSCFDVTPGYHLTIAHGGYLRPGTYVRVRCWNNSILRIDLRSQTAPLNRHR